MRKAIVVISDANYIRYASYLFAKIRKFDIKEPLYLLTDGVSQEEFEEHFSKIKNCFMVQCDNRIKDLKFVSNRHVTRATFIKLLLPELLPNDLDRILYLDVDVYLNRNINPILEFPLRDVIAATQFANGEAENLHGHSDHSYFSAGVLLIDANKWRSADISNKCLDILARRNDSFMYQDMDVLNLMFLEAWQIMPPSFNFMNQPELNYVANTKNIAPIIIHFPGPLKPWTREANSRIARAWRADFISMGYELEKNRTDHLLVKWLLNISDFRQFKSVIKLVLGKTFYENVKKWLMKK